MQTKPYRIGYIRGTPNLDSLPVAKIADYPLEKRDYKPFAQAVLCLGRQAGEKTLFLRMWAFEVSPPEGSTLECVLYPYPNAPNTALCLRLWHRGDESFCGAALLKNGSPAFSNAPEQLILHTLGSHPHNGEDLQGVYWGRLLTLPVSTIEEMGGPAALGGGGRVPGNFYKTCPQGPQTHMGSLFRADWQQPYAPQSMGQFQIVNY